MKTAIEKLEALFYNEADPTINSSSWVIHERTFKKLILAAKEIEKEQIINAHGLKYYDIGEVTITGENYYNQTYNQKQHIIDIMKADENDGLYNQNES